MPRYEDPPDETSRGRVILGLLAAIPGPAAIVGGFESNSDTAFSLGVYLLGPLGIVVNAALAGMGVARRGAWVGNALLAVLVAMVEAFGVLLAYAFSSGDFFLL